MTFQIIRSSVSIVGIQRSLQSSCQQSVINLSSMCHQCVIIVSSVSHQSVIKHDKYAPICHWTVTSFLPMCHQSVTSHCGMFQTWRSPSLCCHSRLNDSRWDWWVLL